VRGADGHERRSALKIQTFVNIRFVWPPCIDAGNDTRPKCYQGQIGSFNNSNKRIAFVWHLAYIHLEKSSGRWAQPFP
jgi:hypothetical protein